MFCWVLLDLSVPIPGSGFQVLLYIFAFKYPTANCKMMSLVRHCQFLIYYPSLWTHTRDTCSMPQPENQSQWHNCYCWSCILGNLSCDLIQTFINDLSAAFIITLTATRSLPHIENEQQVSINNVGPCIMVNLHGKWLQTVINDILDVIVDEKNTTCSLSDSENVRQ